MAVDYPKTRMDNFFAKAAGSELADDSMEPITDREYWINEMAKKTAGGGLPTIEEGDDGKVLTVSSGEAVWASGGGGGGVTIVECTYNSGAHTITSTATASELLEACLNGLVIMSYTDDESYDVSLLHYLSINIISMFEDNTSYIFVTALGVFRADAATDYPVMTLE